MTLSTWRSSLARAVGRRGRMSARPCRRAARALPRWPRLHVSPASTPLGRSPMTSWLTYLRRSVRTGASQGWRREVRAASQTGRRDTQRLEPWGSSGGPSAAILGLFLHLFVSLFVYHNVCMFLPSFV